MPYSSDNFPFRNTHPGNDDAALMDLLMTVPELQSHIDDLPLTDKESRFLMEVAEHIYHLYVLNLELTHDDLISVFDEVSQKQDFDLSLMNRRLIVKLLATLVDKERVSVKSMLELNQEYKVLADAVSEALQNNLSKNFDEFYIAREVAKASYNHKLDIAKVHDILNQLFDKYKLTKPKFDGLLVERVLNCKVGPETLQLYESCDVTKVLYQAVLSYPKLGLLQTLAQSISHNTSHEHLESTILNFCRDQRIPLRYMDDFIIQQLKNVQLENQGQLVNLLQFEHQLETIINGMSFSDAYEFYYFYPLVQLKFLNANPVNQENKTFALIESFINWFRACIQWMIHLFSYTNTFSASDSDALKAYKQKMMEIFDKYISCWKWSMFGHHHDARARALRHEIAIADGPDRIMLLLERQKQLFDCVEDITPIQWSNDSQNRRWNQPKQVLNRPLVLSNSGFYNVIQQALDVDVYPLKFYPS